MKSIIVLLSGGIDSAVLLAPFLGMTKRDIVSLGVSLGVPFEKTYSCYRGTEPPCGECATCRQREEALKSILL